MKKYLLAIALFGAMVPLWAAAPEWVRGQIESVDIQRSRILINHEAIKSIKSIKMEAMVMPFSVAKGVSLSRLKPGDKVRFTFVNKDSHLTIDRIESVK